MAAFEVNLQNHVYNHKYLVSTLLLAIMLLTASHSIDPIENDKKNTPHCNTNPVILSVSL